MGFFVAHDQHQFAFRHDEKIAGGSGVIKKLFEGCVLQLGIILIHGLGWLDVALDKPNVANFQIEVQHTFRRILAAKKIRDHVTRERHSFRIGGCAHEGFPFGVDTGFHDFHSTSPMLIKYPCMLQYLSFNCNAIQRLCMIATL